VADPILVHAGSPCGQQLAAWEAELNGQARAIDPMRFDCGMAAIRLQHDPYYYGYSYLFMLAVTSVKSSTSFVFYEWRGLTMRPKKRQYEEEEKNIETWKRRSCGI